ncbi:hypothetical protein QJQ45_026114 [Haematococcus lacustris]|nr:hypothetical protein QJQ45_026114 [Haematococcus lacustris]
MEFTRSEFAASLEKARARFAELVKVNDIAVGSIGAVRSFQDGASGLLAIKTYDVSRTTHRLTNQRAQAEVKVAQQLQHPLAPDYQACVQTTDGMLHLIMRTQPGYENLFELVHRAHGLDEALVQHIVAQLVCLLHHLHARLHLVYVDLKPENILLQPDGRTIMLVDYDLCRYLVDPQQQVFPAGPPRLPALTPPPTPLPSSALGPAASQPCPAMPAQGHSGTATRTLSSQGLAQAVERAEEQAKGGEKGAQGAIAAVHESPGLAPAVASQHQPPHHHHHHQAGGGQQGGHSHSHAPSQPLEHHVPCHSSIQQQPVAVGLAALCLQPAPDTSHSPCWLASGAGPAEVAGLALKAAHGSGSAAQQGQQGLGPGQVLGQGQEKQGPVGQGQALPHSNGCLAQPLTANGGSMHAPVPSGVAAQHQHNGHVTHSNGAAPSNSTAASEGTPSSNGTAASNGIPSQPCQERPRPTPAAAGAAAEESTGVGDQGHECSQACGTLSNSNMTAGPACPTAAVPPSSPDPPQELIAAHQQGQVLLPSALSSEAQPAIAATKPTALAGVGPGAAAPSGPPATGSGLAGGDSSAAASDGGGDAGEAAGAGGQPGAAAGAGGEASAAAAASAGPPSGGGGGGGCPAAGQANGVEGGAGMKRSTTVAVFDSQSCVLPGIDTTGTKQPHFWGTLEYIAPEVIEKGAAAHGCASDWWALGVLTYELLYARSPFVGATQERTMYNITMRAVDFPASLRVSAKAKSFVRSLLRQRVEYRLGSRQGVAELMAHPWFENVQWPSVPGFDASCTPIP